jgi:hypothetical protein
LSRQCGILNISQPYRPSWPLTGIAFTVNLKRLFVRHVPRNTFFCETTSCT